MIFSILAFIALLFSICITDRNKSLSVQALSCLFEAIYDFWINAITGAMLSLVNMFRTFIFVKKNKFSKSIYLCTLVFFEGVIIFNCIFTWSGNISLLPTIGSIIRTYCLWQTDTKLVRISGITTAIFYGLYYTYYQSWFMVFGDILLFVVSIYAIYKNDILNENKENNLTDNCQENIEDVYINLNQKEEAI